MVITRMKINSIPRRKKRREREKKERKKKKNEKRKGYRTEVINISEIIKLQSLLFLGNILSTKTVVSKPTLNPDAKTRFYKLKQE